MPRYDDDDYDDDIRLPRRRDAREREPRAQSGMGMTSIAIAVVTGLALMVVIFAIAIVSDKNGGQFNDKDPLSIGLVLGFLGSIGIAIVGLVLGLVGSFQSDRNPVLAIVGSVLNGVILLGVMFLVCLGLVMG